MSKIANAKHHVYNPLEFTSLVEVFTFTMIASFFSWKLLNSFHDNIFDPWIDEVIDDPDCEEYYILMGESKLKVGKLLKEIMKWIMIIIVLMIIHNFLVKYKYVEEIKN